MSETIVVIFSGGMDSYTLLNRALKNDLQVSAVTFNYGQRHAKEIEYAVSACVELNVPHKVIDITAINELLQGSSLTSNIDIPEGHYADETMRSTIVPNRNMILLSLAVGYAISIGAEKVFYGAHSGDHAIYPDCRPEFVEKMNNVCAIANYEPVEIVTPYLNYDKGEIVKDGLLMGLDYTKTWSCYNGKDMACGKCGACFERIEAFGCNNMSDPSGYG
jgi:7-cyano-7-deazaguanine synthase|tara:strand:- start:10430 stop:11086 length:657 start_codon:yes stop_codon:yes gene_type:complete